MTALMTPDVTVAEHHKGFPPSVLGRSVGELVGKLGVATRDFLSPLLTLDGAALHHNLAAMQRFCADHDLSHAPHIKTSMSPEIVQAQCDHGIWALTVATPNQLMTVRRHSGLSRIFLANELIDPTAIEWISAETARDESLTVFCYVDSTAGVEALEAGVRRHYAGRRFPVVVELGIPDCRAGVRTPADAVTLAKQVLDSEYLELAGVGGYEGVLRRELGPLMLADVREFLARLRTTAEELLRVRGDSDHEFIVTVGGSGYFELVADELGSTWSARPECRVVLRSGCYVTHDSVWYQRQRELVGTEYAALQLRPSLELWAYVLSRPEPDLAIVGFGKRDTGFDSGLPVPQHVVREGNTTVEPARPGIITLLNDQHAYLKAEPERDLQYGIGDLVGFGIAHPCSTLDKWRLVPVIDDDHRMTGAIRTLF